VRRALVLLAVPLAVGVAAACSSFDAAETQPTPVTDAGEDRTEPQDAADAADAGATKDGGYCASRVGDEYCQDFDSLLDVTTLLPEKSAKSGLSLTQSVAVSPTLAASFFLSPDEPGSYAVFKKPVLGHRPIRVEADMLFGQLEDSAQTLQSLTMNRKNGAVQLGRACAPDADSGVLGCSWFAAICLFNVDGATSAQCTNHFLPPGSKALASRDTWSHVALEVTFAALGHFKLSIDNEVLEMDAPTYEVGEPPADAPTIVTVGVAANQGTPTVNLFVDNVVVMLR
jgi:hypothetical protein